MHVYIRVVSNLYTTRDQDGQVSEGGYFAERTKIPRFYQVHPGSKNYETARFRAHVLPMTAFAGILAV